MENREPPNLRDAECCVNCKHYSEHYEWYCDKHVTGIEKSQVCDDYIPIEAEAGEGGEG